MTSRELYKQGLDKPDDKDLSREEQIWKEYTTLVGNTKELGAVMNDPKIKFPFRIYAIQTLLGPDLVANSLQIVIPVSPDLIPIAAQLAHDSMGSTRASLLGASPDRYKNEVSYRCLSAYNELIAHLLPSLDEEQGAGLFEQFMVVDVYQAPNFSGCYDGPVSGNYFVLNPLWQILSNPDMPDKWKRSAISKIHEVLDSEKNADAIEYSYTLAWYKQILVDLTTPVDGRSRIDGELLEAEIACLIDGSPPGPISWSTGLKAETVKLMGFLKDRELKHRLIKRLFPLDGGKRYADSIFHFDEDDPRRDAGFYVFTEEDVNLARGLTREFIDEDVELADEIARRVNNKAIFQKKQFEKKQESDIVADRTKKEADAKKTSLLAQMQISA